MEGSGYMSGHKTIFDSATRALLHKLENGGMEMA